MQTLENKDTTIENKFETLEDKIKYLESGLYVSKNTNDVLPKELNKLQQYSKRYCLIISSIPIKIPKRWTT